MSSKLVVVVAAVALVAVALFSTKTSNAIQPTALGVNASDVSLRQPSGESVLADQQPGDYFQRHPETRISAGTVDLSDYYLRHLAKLEADDFTLPVDYFQRHPDILKRGNETDLSDWFLRHPVGR